ncbi:MAG: outer membrane beta-barrel protein [Bacteroidia bacterium]|nr:outer membrane beta-barrel protein [Bacteroidia bacterium]
MKHLRIFYLLFLFLIYSTLSYSQKGEFQIRGGVGLAVYGTKSEFIFDFFGMKFHQTEEDGAATVHVPVELRYGLTERFSAGLDVKFGSYLYDPDSAEGKSNRFLVIGPHVEFNLIANENFRWYLGAGFNTAALELQEDKEETIPTRYISKYTGAGIRVNTGILWFFTHPLGLHFNVAFDSHAFKLKNFSVNGNDTNLDNIEGKLTVKGADMVLGLVFRF